MNEDLEPSGSLRDPKTGLKEAVEALETLDFLIALCKETAAGRPPVRLTAASAVEMLERIRPVLATPPPVPLDPRACAHEYEASVYREYLAGTLNAQPSTHSRLTDGGKGLIVRTGEDPMVIAAAQPPAPPVEALDLEGAKEAVAMVLLKDYDQQYSNGHVEEFYPLAESILSAITSLRKPAPSPVGVLDQGERISESELSQIEVLMEKGVSPSPAQCLAMVQEIRRRGVSKPAPLVWTKEKPKVEGWYWMRYTVHLFVERICKDATGEFYAETVEGNEYDMEGYEFAGPIPEPLAPNGDPQGTSKGEQGA